MNLTSEQLVELEALLSELADDRLSGERRLQLEAVLQSDPDARDHYIRFLAMCNDLHEIADTALSAEELEEEGARSNLPERPEGCFAQIGPDPFFNRKRLFWLVTGAVPLAVSAVLVLMLWPWDGQQVEPLAELPIVARLQTIDGVVEVSSPSGQTYEATAGLELRAGPTVATQGQESHAEIRLLDGTMIFVAGDTLLRFSETEPSRIDVESGSIAASVRPQPADRPLVISTKEARIEVLGTQLSVMREGRRTRVGVVEGGVRVTRLSDERTVTLTAGQAAEASPNSDLQPTPIRPAPDTWSLDFKEGLPNGWQAGQLVFDDLPEDDTAAVRTTPTDRRGQRRHVIKSHNAWSDGFFTLHEDSRLHVRYRLDKPGKFLLYVVCRQHDFGQPVCTLLTCDSIGQRQAGSWHTLSLPMNKLHRTKTEDTVPLDGQLVCFLMVFDSSAYNPGLTIDRIWVTREANLDRDAASPQKAPHSLDHSEGPSREDSE
jgi:ferric-dicitrate binding protein FerR (iron transport regulator)